VGSAITHPLNEVQEEYGDSSIPMQTPNLEALSSQSLSPLCEAAINRESFSQSGTHDCPRYDTSAEVVTHHRPLKKLRGSVKLPP